MDVPLAPRGNTLPVNPPSCLQLPNHMSLSVSGLVVCIRYGPVRPGHLWLGGATNQEDSTIDCGRHFQPPRKSLTLI